MTVTIGRRELLAALGGAAAAWPSSVMQSRRLMSDIRLPPTRLGSRRSALPHAQPAAARPESPWDRPEMF